MESDNHLNGEKFENPKSRELKYHNMKKLVYLFMSILTLFVSGCSSDSDYPSDNYFQITASNGKVYRTNYVNIPLPNKNGTFSLQYSKPSQFNNNHKLLFLILIDNNNDGYLDVEIPSLPITNKVYKTSSISGQYISYGLSLDNKDSCSDCRSEIIFTEFNYPGLISGTVKNYSPTGKIIDSGEFNFTSN